MNLLIFFKTIFTNKNNYNQLNDYDKSIWIYKMNSYLGRLYPNNAEILNNINYNPTVVSDIWFNSLKKINKIPDNLFPTKNQPIKILTLEERILNVLPKDITNDTTISMKKMKKSK